MSGKTSWRAADYRKWRARTKKARHAYEHDYRQKNAARIKANRDRHRAKRSVVEKRRFEHLSRFGMTKEDYDRLLKKQGGRCAICGVSKPSGKGRRLWSVDHCHKTGRVRGLLCLNCNSGLGQFKDDAELVRAALSYLEAA